MVSWVPLGLFLGILWRIGVVIRRPFGRLLCASRRRNAAIWGPSDLLMSLLCRREVVVRGPFDLPTCGVDWGRLTTTGRSGLEVDWGLVTTTGPSGLGVDWGLVTNTGWQDCHNAVLGCRRLSLTCHRLS